MLNALSGDAAGAGVGWSSVLNVGAPANLLGNDDGDGLGA
jgi:hypothetical protein